MLHSADLESNRYIMKTKPRCDRHSVASGDTDYIARYWLVVYQTGGKYLIRSEVNDTI